MAVVSDASMVSRRRPAIVYGMRGQLHFELHVDGPKHDLHCGVFGGAVRNPLHVLTEVLAGLHDRSGRVAVRGFYDAVRDVSAAERADLARSGPSDQALRRTAGSVAFGEPGYTAFERTTIRPALTVNGIRGGYEGSGNKAILPARASAKVTIRLVPDQAPARIEQLVRAHVARAMPPDVAWRMETRVFAAPALLDRRHPAMRVAARAYRAGFGEAPAMLRMGGTIPVVPLLGSILGVPTVVMAFGLPEDNIHAPDERMHLPTFARAIDTAIALLSFAASLKT
jgi:acetylornithine deacetylase/succinyl-diaminopimelate desuccinylase-like protein